MTTQTFKGHQLIRTAAGDIEQEVAIVIDLDALAKQLGPRAFKSKGKKATCLKGAVVVKQVNAREAATGR